ncbi:hypothetical protein ABFA07_007482 [Porites harrisoni]
MAPKRPREDKDPAQVRKRKNAKFAKQTRKRLNKWHSETNNPAFVIYLRGGAVLCEGQREPTEHLTAPFYHFLFPLREKISR